MSKGVAPYRMDTKMDFSTISKLVRFKEIVMTLLKYGFDDMVQRLDFPGMGIIKKIRQNEEGMETYERIRCILEELGPTFIKFGQIMSLRPDLLPSALLQELSKLQDEVAPVDLDQIRTVVERGMGREIEDIFSMFDAEPLAAASLSQVHRGVLRREGHIVCIKVQRPGIRPKIEADLNILEAIADRLHERSDDLRTYDLPNLVRVTRRNLLNEIDFTREARNMKIARTYAADSSDIYIPEVYDNYCSEEVLVTEYIHGAKIKEEDISLLGDPMSLASQGLNSAIKQILEDGFFHADPHPGNLLISQQRGLSLVDWGMVGRLTERDRYEMIDLIKAIVEKNSRSMLHALLRIASGDQEIDERALERELIDILDSYYAVPIKDVNVGQLLLAVTELLRTYHLRLPPDLVIMVKALVTAEGTARQIYPDLNVISEAEGYVKKLAAERYNAETLWQNIRSALSHIFSLQYEIPRRYVKIADKLEHGRLSIRFRHENLGGLKKTLENISNRLAFSIIIGALIIGSSLIITTGTSPLFFGLPVLGIIGYMISSLLGLWLIFNMIRTKKY
jgi:ubiquinone biosynthesis protein